MEYTKVEDPEAVAKEGLKNEARQKEELAYAAETAWEEGQALQLRKLDRGLNHDALHEDAIRKRKEADTYVKAAGLQKSEISDIRLAYLNRWLEHIELNHIHHSAVLKVKAELGEPTASYDSILASLDVGHDLALKKIHELSGSGKKLSQSERRTAPRSKK